jgi:hypothetical protein
MIMTVTGINSALLKNSTSMTRFYPHSATLFSAVQVKLEKTGIPPPYKEITV